MAGRATLTPFFKSSSIRFALVGIHRMNRAFLPAMRQRSQVLIIDISSTAGRCAVPFNGIYRTCKWALECYSRAMRGELTSSGVDLVTIEPGPFTTGLFSSARPPVDVERRAERRAESYPQIVRQTLAGMVGVSVGLFSDPETSTAPQLVVDRLLELVDNARWHATVPQYGWRRFWPERPQYCRSAVRYGLVADGQPDRVRNLAGRQAVMFAT
jgi:NAD(P)-dependent dehydrogenase (short-subunit alcohol dehydrogenase family)